MASSCGESGRGGLVDEHATLAKSDQNTNRESPPLAMTKRIYSNGGDVVNSGDPHKGGAQGTRERASGRKDDQANAGGREKTERLNRGTGCRATGSRARGTGCATAADGGRRSQPTSAASCGSRSWRLSGTTTGAQTIQQTIRRAGAPIEKPGRAPTSAVRRLINVGVIK